MLKSVFKKNIFLVTPGNCTHTTPSVTFRIFTSTFWSWVLPRSKPKGLYTTRSSFLSFLYAIHRLDRTSEGIWNTLFDVNISLSYFVAYFMLDFTRTDPFIRFDRIFYYNNITNKEYKFSLIRILMAKLQTYTGSILVAVNPYKEIDIYTTVSKTFFLFNYD